MATIEGEYWANLMQKQKGHRNPAAPLTNLA